MDELYPRIYSETRTMLFVDGENFVMRYGQMHDARVKETRDEPVTPLGVNNAGVWFERDKALWAQQLNPPPGGHVRMVRRYFYTSAPGDDPARVAVAQWLKDRGFEAPRVFHRDKERGSKQVDISLTTDMLTHAHRKHYNVAILVTGDEDYVPLVRAVQGEGARVHLWAFSKGLSPKLKMEADHFACLDGYFGV